MDQTKCHECSHDCILEKSRQNRVMWAQYVIQPATILVVLFLVFAVITLPADVREDVLYKLGYGPQPIDEQISNLDGKVDLILEHHGIDATEKP